MQRDEAAVKAFALEIAQRAFGRVKGVCIHALRTQGGQHAGARHEGDFALGRHAAHEHGHLAQVTHLAGHVSLHGRPP